MCGAWFEWTLGAVTPCLLLTLEIYQVEALSTRRALPRDIPDNSTRRSEPLSAKSRTRTPR
ncbi:MAG: hypothetical protein GY820_21420 [Gammaproteobacteria bacterium]|nr:hypothetical protein [Gammaproteobacteria bacterium]